MDTLTPAQKWAPYALSAGTQLKYDPAFILATWLYETGNGTNTGTKYNNLAGIKRKADPSKGIFDPTDSIHAGYTSLSAFTQDYIRVANQSNMRDFLSAARSSNDPATLLKAWDASPWAESNYDKSGFLSYYNQAAKVLGTGLYSPFDLSNVFGGDILGGINTDGIITFLKEKWWLVAGGLVIIAIVKG